MAEVETIPFYQVLTLPTSHQVVVGLVARLIHPEEVAVQAGVDGAMQVIPAQEHRVKVMEVARKKPLVHTVHPVGVVRPHKEVPQVIHSAVTVVMDLRYQLPVHRLHMPVEVVVTEGHVQMDVREATVVPEVVVPVVAQPQRVPTEMVVLKSADTQTPEVVPVVVELEVPVL